MNFKHELQQYLLNLPKAKRINNKEISLRCPFCGDSRRNLNKTRFYMNINPDDDSIMLYYCFNCLIHGIVTPDVLKMFDITNIKLNGEVLAYNKKSFKSTYKFRKKITRILDVIFPNYSDSLIARKKIKYLNERLGVNGDIGFWRSFKIIFDFNELIRANKDTISVDDKEIYKLNNYYVSFITSKNDYVISRDITGNGYRKHLKSSLTKDDIDNSFKFYSLPNKISNLTSEEISINIAEGTFDIIGVFLHVKDRLIENNLYLAVTGAGYKSVVHHVISEGLLGNVILNIYSDRDKDINFYLKELKNYMPYFKSVYIHYNRLGKDFGVRKDEISVYTERIK